MALSDVPDLRLIDTEEGLHSLFDVRKAAGVDTCDIEKAHALVAAEMRDRALVYEPLAKALPPTAAPLPTAPATGPVDPEPATGTPAGPQMQSQPGPNEYSPDERRQHAVSGYAMPDGSFPILNEADLHQAIKLVSQAQDPQAAMIHIIERAKSMGMEAMLPKMWLDANMGKPQAPAMGAHSMPAPAAPKPGAGMSKSLGRKVTEALVTAMRKTFTAEGIDIDESTIDMEPDVDYAVMKSDASLRYTLGPVYIPNQYDAHDEWATPEDMEKSCWDYVRETGADRKVFFQHSDKPAGEWVGILTWPQAVHSRMQKSVDGVMKAEEVTFPAGTPYMGVIWEPWAWELVRKGEITGFSMGGSAHRVEAQIPSV